MNSKYQAIISTPAMTVPAMSTEEIHITLLEASVEYVKRNITLETLVLLASKIQHFMGLRAEDSSQIGNMLSKIIDLAQNNKQQNETDIFIESMLLESVNSYSKINSSQVLH